MPHREQESYLREIPLVIDFGAFMGVIIPTKPALFFWDTHLPGKKRLMISSKKPMTAHWRL